MQLTDGEKLIAIMLADLLAGQNIRGEIEAGFVKEAILSDKFWAFKWQYPGVFQDTDPDPELVTETVEILSMCSYLERLIQELSPGDLNEIPEEIRTVFKGFDANNDEHFGIASMLIETMGLWSEYREHPLNSHGSVLPHYRAMKEVYDGIGGPNSGGLSLDEIQAVLAA